MFLENERSAGSGGNGRQVLLLGQPARIQYLVGFHDIDLGSADHCDRQSDRSQRVIKAQAAGAVVVDGVGAGTDGGENRAAFGEIVGRGGDAPGAIGGEYPGFTVRHAVDVLAEVESLYLIDVLAI